MSKLEQASDHLEQLAVDWWVRSCAARNPNTSLETLELLASDDDWFVREYVARNPNTPPKALEQLANDKEWNVRYWVALNPNTPHYIKKYLKIQKHLQEL
jgi:hypothetical protein